MAKDKTQPIFVRISRPWLAKVDAYLGDTYCRSALLRAIVGQFLGIFGHKGPEKGREFWFLPPKKHGQWQTEFLRSLGYDLETFEDSAGA